MRPEPVPRVDALGRVVQDWEATCRKCLVALRAQTDAGGRRVEEMVQSLLTSMDLNRLPNPAAQMVRDRVISVVRSAVVAPVSL